MKKTAIILIFFILIIAGCYNKKFIGEGVYQKVEYQSPQLFSNGLTIIYFEDGSSIALDGIISKQIAKPGQYIKIWQKHTAFNIESSWTIIDSLSNKN